MELWQLRTFSAVAKNLHFTRASEELNLSQPAVSHQIKALEEEIGEPLFLRTNDGITLTKAGETMLAHAGKILDTADQIINEVRETKDEPHGDVVFSTVMMSLENPFPRVYTEFTKLHKGINLTFQNGLNSKDILSKIKRGEVDIGLLAINADSKKLVEIPYGSFPVVPVCGADNRIAEKKNISPGDLESEEWALVSPTIWMRERIEQKFAEVGIAPKNVLDTNDGSVILGLLNMGKTITMLPLWGIATKLKNGDLRIIDTKALEFDMPLCLVWKANGKSKSLKTFISFLFDHQITGIQLDQSNKI